MAGYVLAGPACAHALEGRPRNWSTIGSNDAPQIAPSFGAPLSASEHTIEHQVRSAERLAIRASKLVREQVRRRRRRWCCTGWPGRRRSSRGLRSGEQTAPGTPRVWRDRRAGRRASAGARTSPCASGGCIPARKPARPSGGRAPAASGRHQAAVQAVNSTMSAHSAKWSAEPAASRCSASQPAERASADHQARLRRPRRQCRDAHLGNWSPFRSKRRLHATLPGRMALGIRVIASVVRLVAEEVTGQRRGRPRRGPGPAARPRPGLPR